MWDKLSMNDRAKYIQMAVLSGITLLNDIRDTYNKYAEGGDKRTRKERITETSAAVVVDNIYKNFGGEEREKKLGHPAHNYDFTISDEEADRLGYYEDAEGHRDDRVKKPTHPTHPSRGYWEGDNFNLTEIGLDDPNHTLFGVVDNWLDPQATIKYKGSYVLPEITVTPKGNYIHNTYDNRAMYPHTYDDGGGLLKDAAYAIMTDDRGGTKGTDRMLDLVIDGLKNRKKKVRERGNVDRNLVSLYIYGNDLGLFREAPELKSKGVDYSSYLKSIGRDPKDVLTYEGFIDKGLSTVTLPSFLKEGVKQAIDSKLNKTYGLYSNIPSPEEDDVAGYVGRLDHNALGDPAMYVSDLWDFHPKSYTEKYGGNGLPKAIKAIADGITYSQAWAADKVGNPFILKQEYPINWVDADTYFDEGANRLSEEIAKDFGILPEITVTPKENFYLESSEYRNGGYLTYKLKKANKFDGGGSLKNNKFDGKNFLKTYKIK